MSIDRELFEQITNIILDMDTYDGMKGHAPALMAADQIMKEIRRHDEECDLVDLTSATEVVETPDGVIQRRDEG